MPSVVSPPLPPHQTAYFIVGGQGSSGLRDCQISFYGYPAHKFTVPVPPGNKHCSSASTLMSLCCSAAGLFSLRVTVSWALWMASSVSLSVIHRAEVCSPRSCPQKPSWQFQEPHSSCTRPLPGPLALIGYTPWLQLSYF